MNERNEKLFYLIASGQIPIIIIGQFNLILAALFEFLLLLTVAHFSLQAPITTQFQYIIILLPVTAILAYSLNVSLHVYIPLVALVFLAFIVSFLFYLSEYRVKKSTGGAR
jgi:hypothetical protein